MAIKIQLRRDLAANWTQNNPLLLNGEIGIETDTLKFKIGNGTQRWNSLSSYAFKIGEANGIATLNSFGKVPLSQLPDQVSFDSSLDATTKANAAKSEAISTASADATTKANSARDEAKSYAEGFVGTSLNLLTTSDIEEGSNLYYTQSRVDGRIDSVTTPLFTNMTSYVDNTITSALDNFNPPNSISTTDDLTEGSANLYFTNGRARSAVANTINNPTLAAANASINDLRIEVGNEYVKLTHKDAANGVAALNASSKISTSVLPTTVAQLDTNGKLLSSAIPTTLATNTYVDSQINGLINSAPGTLDTLGEIATLLQSAESVTGLIDLITLKSPIASPTFTGTVTIPAGASISGYATLDSPTFTGIVTIPDGASISGYATSLSVAADIAAASATAEDYTDAAISGINNSLTGYIETGDRNSANGVAGLDADTKIPAIYLPTITNSLLENSSITLNGTQVNLGSSLNVGYSNGVSSSNPNKIIYGTDATPPSSGNNAGDIYIQY
jgi:hypothetical protein